MTTEIKFMAILLSVEWSVAALSFNMHFVQFSKR
jgi:hypothetical protein